MKNSRPMANTESSRAHLCCHRHTLVLFRWYPEKKKTVEKREPSSSQTWQATDQFSLGKSCSFNPQRWVMVVHDTNYVGPCKIVKTIIHNIYISMSCIYYIYVYIYGYICVLTCLTCYVYIYIHMLNKYGTLYLLVLVRPIHVPRLHSSLWEDQATGCHCLVSTVDNNNNPCIIYVYVYIYPYAQCMVYLPTKLGVFWCKCWPIFHAWSIWAWENMGK